MHKKTIDMQASAKNAMKRERYYRIHDIKRGMFRKSIVTMAVRFPNFWVYKEDADKVTRIFRKAEKRGVTIHYMEQRGRGHQVRWSDIIIQGRPMKVSKVFTQMDEHITRMEEYDAEMKENMSE